MSIEEKIADFIKRGAIQLSRKYRTIGVPPKLEEGQTFLELLRQRYPSEHARLEEMAKQWLCQYDGNCHVTLTPEEFNEWLAQRGCTPMFRPPEPFKTWGEVMRYEKREKK